ncbi:hypothetical protein K6W36_12440 [Acetobacter senegalensis]|uniref:phage tail tip lysozyme n=1 Tax=Acetobacter senegalensis TaxID=446692 RepID=UPI001EDA3896|nr:phage tail tip lysozyme [Acetobacter senegalensis]MCG4261374.1 hypothetical protein [Acetobacter senegalensis]
MAEAGVIREFLVSLGWNIKRDDQRQFEDALATTKRAALALTATLAGVVAGVAKVAQSYEQMNYAAQRAQSSVGGMQAYAYAISQMGGNADAARASLQNIGNFLRSSPGAEGFIARLGVQTRDAKGNLRDTSAMMADLSKRFREIPYYRAKATAGLLGIDENTLQAMIRGLGDFGAEYNRIYRSMGVNQQEAAEAGTWFMRQLRETGVVLQVLRDRVAISLMRGVGGDIVRLREIIEQNADRISHAIDLAAKFVLVLGAALVQLFARGSEILTRVYDWFSHLDGGTKQWIETLGALLLAWRLLSTGIMATPIGRVIALGLAILALYDDYKVWKAGGVSLIDWEKWKPGFDALENGIGEVKKALIDLWPSVKPNITPLEEFFRIVLVDSLKATGKAIGGIAKAIDDLANKRWGAAWDDIKGMYYEGKDNVIDVAKAGGNLIGDWAGNLVGMDSQKVAQAYQYLTSQGIDRDHALAMIGNWQQESSLDPSKKNGSYTGIEQWSPERRANILKGTGIDVANASFGDSMKAALWELRNGNEARNFKTFLSTVGVNDAAAFFNQGIERSADIPGTPGFAKRINYAHGAATLSNLVTPSPPITYNQTNNIHGAKDPHATAAAIGKATDNGVNSIVRNLKARRS